MLFASFSTALSLLSTVIDKMKSFKENILYIRIAILLFIASDIIHRLLMFYAENADVHPLFAIISRTAIYAWFSWEMQRTKTSLKNTIALVILLTFFEYIFLGFIFLVFFKLYRPDFEFILSIVGLVLSYPLVIIVAVIISLLTYIIASKLSFSRIID